MLFTFKFGPKPKPTPDFMLSVEHNSDSEQLMVTMFIVFYRCCDVTRVARDNMSILYTPTCQPTRLRFNGRHVNAALWRQAAVVPQSKSHTTPLSDEGYRITLGIGLATKDLPVESLIARVKNVMFLGCTCRPPKWSCGQTLRQLVFRHNL